uniref:Uncharacterized protein n=1 Tax=Oncorhynchus kisutch TaxID=8019 RepID=A0A8C7H1D2_ONCKI
MIQSSQPSSLKFTCNGFLLHLDFDFLPCLFPWRFFNIAVLRLRLALELERGPLSFPFSPWPINVLPSLLSLKRVCLFLDLVKTTKMAFFCCDSLSVLSSMALTSRQNWLPYTLVYILNSAPSTSALSERVETSNRYCCLRKGESGRSSVKGIK